MDKRAFDITIAFDKEEYLDTQVKILVNCLKDNVPKDTILHIVTNRNNDDTLNWVKERIPTKIYYREPFTDLKSRCQYMFKCFDIETDKPWVVKLDLDVLPIQHMRKIKRVLEDDVDVVIQVENRRIIKDNITEKRIWRNIYRTMGIKLPNFKINYIENGEEGYPLFNTGVIFVKSKHLKYINKRWVELTKIAERWINFGIHPNEFAFTAMLFDSDMTFKLTRDLYNFNPIGHFRKNPFPDITLEENCKLPSDVVLFHYHKPQWLKHCSKTNPKIRKIIDDNKDNIPEEWWNLSNEIFMEKS